ncbi:alpha/beta fold hydrolase [Sinosporangium siamense]|uniref:Lysophospholipase n=1 Tax=Sinosporangium siamense TaxID=1367973 RepID=A0A919V3P1_9ACTN|nr:alpha/beta hydrolase [Sinosporangium siamense]GII91140.1 lysophospholipase [Sinosporangium siamense]
MALPIVLIHGIRVSHTMWHPTRAHLTDHPTAAPDLPGHGTRRGEPFTMRAATDAVAAAIDHLGGRALVAGLSLGGYVALAAAQRHPEQVAGVVAMGCTAVPYGIGLKIYDFLGRAARHHPETANSLSAYALRRVLPGEAGEAMVEGGLACEVMAETVAAVAASDPLRAVASYPGPVWLVNGSRDPFRADERRFLTACRHGRLLLLPRTGHLAALNDPRALAHLFGDLASATSSLRPVAAP